MKNLILAIATSAQLTAASDPLETWTLVRQPDTHRIACLTRGGGRFVAVGDIVLSSEDGIHWTQGDLEGWNPPANLGSPYSLLCLASGNDRFIAGGFDPLLGRSQVVTFDRTTWANPWSDSVRIAGIAYGRGIFVAGRSGTLVLNSEDGMNWVRHKTGELHGFNRITFGNGQFLAAGEGGAILASGDISSPVETAPVNKVVAWGDVGEAQKRLPPGLTNVVAIGSGGSNIPGFADTSVSAALKQDGTIIEWEYDPGWSWAGETNVLFGMTNVVSIAVSARELPVLWADGTLHSARDPELALSPTNVVAVSGNRGNVLALRDNGTVFSLNGLSFEGYTEITDTTTSRLSNVVAIAAGGMSFGALTNQPWGLALRDDGTVAGWGADDAGQIDLPVNLTNVVAIAAGYGHGMALKADGTVATWGVWARLHPSPSGLTNVVAIAAAGRLGGNTPEAMDGYCLALKADGTVSAWGNLEWWGVTEVPAGLSNVVAIAAGPYRALALVGSGPPVLHTPILKPVRDSMGFRCAISSECGRVYRLEYKERLEGTAWTALPLVAGNGRLIQLFDSTRSVGPGRFYRVRRW